MICIFVLSRTSDIYNLKIANRLKTSPFFRLAFYIMEVWKKIKNYEGYEASNYGRIKSFKKGKERILKGHLHVSGYLVVSHNKKMVKIHQLIAIAFLKHTPCGMIKVINHRNFVKTDNRVENLEIVTARENSNKKHIKSKSQYVGVCWDKKSQKWQSQITVNKKLKFLGRYNTEIEANDAYQIYLKSIN